MSKLVGTWDLESSEKFDEYMSALGVGFITRKAAANIKPTVTIENNGDKWTIKMKSTLKSSEISFTDGVEFDETTLDGRQAKSTVKSEGADKLVHIQRDQSGKLVTTIVREVVGDKLVQTLTAGDVVCTRTFKRTA